VSDTLWAVGGIAGAVLIGLAVALAAVAWTLRGSERRAMARRAVRLRFAEKLRLGSALMRDPRVPLYARVLVLAMMAYLVMPLDIIPDFIPVLGHLDDALVVVLAAGLFLRSVPLAVLEEHIARLEGGASG
jgi:uncharacterized membrane protein YkvA (DUF1232 family)